MGVVWLHAWRILYKSQKHSYGGPAGLVAAWQDEWYTALMKYLGYIRAGGEGSPTT